MIDQPASTALPHSERLLPWGERVCSAVVRAAVALGSFFGATNLAAWTVPAIRPMVMLPGVMVMRANNALSVLVTSIALLLWSNPNAGRTRRWAAQVLASITALIGLLTTLEYLTGANLGIDQLLAPGTFPGDLAAGLVTSPGRMSLNAALSLSFLGLSLVLLDTSVRLNGRPHYIAPVFALLGMMPPAAGLVGYLLGSSAFTGLLRSTIILWHAAALLCLLALGVLASRPLRPPVRRILAQNAGGTLLRWLLPGSTFLFLALGWLITRGRAAGLVAPGEGTALMLYGGLILLFLLMIAASRAVRRAETRAELADAAFSVGEERFHTLADNISQLAWTTDAEGAVTWYNRRWQEYTGYSVEDPALAAADVLPPSHRESVLRKFRAALRSGEEWEDVFPLRSRDGEYRWFLSRARPIRDESGRITQWFGTNTDVTEQRNLADQLALAKEASDAASQAMSEAAERFRFLAESVALQVWTAAPGGALDFVNQEVVSYFGLGEVKVVLGEGWTSFVHPDDLPSAQQIWRAALDAGSPYEAEFRLRRHDGEHRWFLVRAQPMSRAGSIVNWFGTNTDIHDLKTAQRSAEAASRAKDDFLAALSHELRTPLAPVLLTATALREDETLPDEVRQSLAMIERNIQLEARLIDDLLDLTRITRGKLPMHNEWCDVHALIGHTFEMIQDEAEGKRLALLANLQARRAEVHGDPARLQQVLWNLLRNAVKFTPAEGRITVRTWNAEQEGPVFLEVVDTGSGFAPEMAERLFLPFEQEAEDGAHRFGGLGLGLAIARAIVDLHGGSIQASSPGRDQGATFTVKLPHAREAAPPPSDLNHAAAPVRAPLSLRILVVEDHEATRTVLERLLAKAGHHVICAGTVAEAVAAHGGHPVDLLVSDLGLPDGSGLELMAKLRATDPKLLGIALSGYGMEDDLARSREVGFVAHLIKPIDFEHLAGTIAQIARTNPPHWP